MLASLKKFMSLLERKDKQRLVVLFTIVIAMSFVQVAGIASILPFLHLAANPEALQEHAWLQRMYNLVGFSSHRSMLVACGWSIMVLLGFSNALSAFSVWQRQRLAWTIAHKVSVRLLRTYTSLPYAFFLHHNSADLMKKIINDVNDLVNGVLLAGFQFISQLIIASMLFALLLVVSTGVALGAVGFLGLAYGVIYLARRKYLEKLGRERLDSNYVRFKTFSELITGIKAIKTDGARTFFMNRFEGADKKFTEIHPKVHFTTVVPRFVVETLAFTAIIGYMLFLLTSGKDFADAIPMLSMFALAGYRLMPALNTAYISAAQMLSSYAAIDVIYDDIHQVIDLPEECEKAIEFTREIALEQVSFGYEEGQGLVIDGISLCIPKGDKVAFVGSTGSGKSTLINMLMGLLPLAQGAIKIDDVDLSSETMTAWRQKIGYVPQDVFLYDDTIARNIAFGAEEVDMERVQQACDIAQIRTFIEQDLTLEYETEIGERGVRLSGGQQQRLGLARALYRAPQILILDEATSALDNATERLVIETIQQRLPDVTMIMIAHRMSTVEHCDQLYVLNQGKVVDQGRYETLLSSSSLFKELTRLG